MIIVLISLTLFLQRTSGDSGVTQSPSVLWVQKGKPAEMNCSHNKGSAYYQMYWFRQQQGKPMERIVYITTSTSELDNNKYSATKERAEDGNFTVKNVESDDSGLYFCAVRDSGVTQSPSVLWVQKGKPAEMNCSHTKSASYNQMYWFRQQQGKPMKRIDFITSSTSEFDNNKYSATKERAEDGNFTVKNVESDDSGLYFCAETVVSLRVPVYFGSRRENLLK
ncbi:hypothetical protein NFI96_022599 [Prochilodus magdalenae]|nr:hypothetical protein NFI96_022599 [Prochilodus magdalenae]